MKKSKVHASYRIFRAILATIVALPPLLAVGLYVALSMPWAQNALRGLAEKELSKVLGSELTIGSVNISPFELVNIGDVKVTDDYGATALYVRNISAGLDVSRLVFNRRIVVDYVDIEGLKADVYRNSPDSPLSISNIIAKLSPKDDKKEKKKFSLKINTLVVDNASLTYNVKGTPEPEDGRFDPNHIDISSLNLSVNIPSLATDNYRANLYSFNFKERSGFSVEDFKVSMLFTPDSIAVSHLSLELPRSRVSFNDIAVSTAAFRRLPKIDTSTPLRLAMQEGSYFTPADISPFVPVLASADMPFDIAFDMLVDDSLLDIEKLRLQEANNAIVFDLYGRAEQYFSPDSLHVEIPEITLSADGPRLAEFLKKSPRNIADKTTLLENLGKIDFFGSLNGGLRRANVEGHLEAAPGDADFAIKYSRPGKYSSPKVSGRLETSGLDLADIAPKAGIGSLSGAADFDVAIAGRKSKGRAELTLDNIEYRGYDYSAVNALVWTEKDQIHAEIGIDDPNAYLSSSGYVEMNPEYFDMVFMADIDRLNPDSLNLWNKYPGYAFSGNVDIALVGDSPEDADGYIRLKDLNFRNGLGEGVGMKNFTITASSAEIPKHIDINSDILQGSISGAYHTKSFLPMAADLMYDFLPVLADSATIAKVDMFRADSIAVNDFELDFTLKSCSDLCRFFKLPVNVIDNIYINGKFDNIRGEAELKVDARWLQQGNKLLQGNFVRLYADRATKEASLYATTSFDTKKGPMSVTLNSSALNNNISNRIDWEIERAIPINGIVDVDAALSRNYDGLVTRAHFNPGQVTFGDILWQIVPSDVTYSGGVLDIRNFALDAGHEGLNINGRVSKNPEDKLVVDLKSVELIDIFETLEIDKALIGGKATGQVVGSSLLTKMPVANADRLSVENISYNYTTLGDAVVKANWVQDKQSFQLSAVIDQPNGKTSRISGDIYATKDSLDINFDTDHVNIGFLQPFMSAFADEVKGVASGNAHLFGTFKNVNLEGDIHADTLSLKLGYTNTTYHVYDENVRIKPGVINISPITLYDRYGNTATFKGWLRHNYFHDPEFEFEVNDARNFLCYDITPVINQRWYGKVFGNSSGPTTVTGVPGYVNIDVNMSTADKSKFTFALLDRLDAVEYDFLSFLDVTVTEIDSLIDIDTTPEEVKEALAKKNKKEEESSSRVDIKLKVDVQPNTRMMLLMDPISGDSITATGKGNLTLEYRSISDMLSMSGTYVLEKGDYNFSMQDIFRKSFVIKGGSSIKFNGDPYNAILDINASYNAQASLSDLDESFAVEGRGSQSVPVHALLSVKGSIHSPVLAFSLEFPTLQEETRRKIASILNTQEMVQRQVAYLISMNRFYTPEYMSGTRGNELVSVASSTLSSQISSMLSQLSDKWRIAPSVRSDRGDFSDVEVDLTLSSNLLNNRLLFNGNFGYRDKSLNTNQFVGDFDIEYLLNPKGSWRLKAYSRYNDQNYYLRSAATTQGVGIMYKVDFDNWFRFLHKRKDKKGAAA